MANNSNLSRSNYSYGQSAYFTASGYEIAIGDHLIVSRTFYMHHGIYAGGGIVIHYSGLSDGLKSGPVTFDTLDTFSAGREITVREYSSPKFLGRKVVIRAESRLGERKYDVHSNNCEDFCTWAITGEHGSQQVELVEKVVGYVAPTVVLTSKVRKHFSRENCFSSDGEAAKSAADRVATASKAAAIAAAAPIVVATKMYKRIFK